MTALSIISVFPSLTSIQELSFWHPSIEFFKSQQLVINPASRIDNITTIKEGLLSNPDRIISHASVKGEA
jgi:hypothetical protein